MAHPRTNIRSTTATPTAGSSTILQTQQPTQQPSATLRLRASSREPQQDASARVRWAEDVVDNEGMGKKSSKVCCIYHKPHEPGESGSEESSSSEDSDSEPDLSRARKAGSGKGRRGHRHGHGGDHGGEGGGNGKGKERRPSPNAYERVPKHGSKKEG